MSEEQEEQKKMECTVDITDSGSWKKKIKVVIPRHEIDKELDKQFSDFRKEAAVPGFRKGRAPRRLIEKRFDEDVRDQAKLRLLAQAFEQIDDGEDFEILGQPDFDPAAVKLPAEGDMIFEYEVEVKPQFEMPPLEGIKVEKPLVEVNAQRINEAIKEMQKRNGAMENITDGGAIEDDMVIGSVTMKVEGVETPETVEKTYMRVGRAVVMGVLVEDMDKTLKGAKIGEVKQCSATVADTHTNEAYRGKKADFTITVKEIRRLKPAELNEDFFKQIGISDEADLRRRIEEHLEDQAERDQRDAMRNQIYKYLDEKINFELPVGIAARFADRVLQRRYYELLNQGIPGDRIVENLEQLKAASSEQANRELKTSFIMESVADKLELSVSEAEVNGFIARAAMYYGRRPEKLKEEMNREGRLESIRSQIRDEKAIDKLLEMAQVVDAPVQAEKTEEAKAKKTSGKASGKPVETEKGDDAEDGSSSNVRKQVKRKPPISDSK